MLIFDKDFYNKNMSKEVTQGIFFNFGDNDEARKEAMKYFYGNSNYTYQDIGEAEKEINNIYNQISFFVYCFIIIISLISVVNIFNTISTNIILRRREFSTLKAIGMTKKQISKSILLEGTLYGIFAAIIGGILSAVLLALLIKLGGGIADMEYKFAMIPFSSSIAVAILATYISSLIPLQKLNKLSIVDGISNNE